MSHSILNTRAVQLQRIRVRVKGMRCPVVVERYWPQITALFLSSNILLSGLLLLSLSAYLLWGLIVWWQIFKKIAISLFWAAFNVSQP